MLLSTSLTNKHLFPGMVLDNAQLVVPGALPCTLSLTIQNIREAPRDGCFHLGVTVNASTNASHAKGKILFQSEGAELFFRKIDLKPLKGK